MENEGNAMRTLNTLKNKKIRKCDYAFSSMVQDEDEDSETFVREVRQTFFNFLKTFLGEIPKCFRAEESLKKLDEQQKVFHKYFDKDQYLNNFEGSERRFANELLKSTSLITFCDDKFNQDQINNYNIFYKIIEKNEGRAEDIEGIH